MQFRSFTAIPRLTERGARRMFCGDRSFIPTPQCLILRRFGKEARLDTDSHRLRKRISGKGSDVTPVVQLGLRRWEEIVVGVGHPWEFGEICAVNRCNLCFHLACLFGFSRKEPNAIWPSVWGLSRADPRRWSYRPLLLDVVSTASQKPFHENSY